MHGDIDTTPRTEGLDEQTTVSHDLDDLGMVLCSIAAVVGIVLSTSYLWPFTYTLMVHERFEPTYGLIPHAWIIPTYILGVSFPAGGAVVQSNRHWRWFSRCFLLGALLSLYPIREAIVAEEMLFLWWLAHFWGILFLVGLLVCRIAAER